MYAEKTSHPKISQQLFFLLRRSLYRIRSNSEPMASTEEPIASIIMEEPVPKEPATADLPPVAEDELAQPDPNPTKEAKPRKCDVAKKATHLSYEEMVKDAIVTLKEKSGSSQYAIAKFLEKKHKQLPSNFKKLLLFHLKKLVAAGKLVRVKNSFKLPSVKSSVAASRPAAAKKKLAVAEPKPAASKAKPAPKPKAATKTTAATSKAKPVTAAKSKAKPAAKAKPMAKTKAVAPAKAKASPTKTKAEAKYKSAPRMNEKPPVPKVKPAAKAKPAARPAKAARTSTRTTTEKKAPPPPKPAPKKAATPVKKAPTKSAKANTVKLSA